MVNTSLNMSVESVHSLREENVELRELEDARLNSRHSSRHTSRSSSRQSQSRPSSVLEGLLTNLAQGVHTLTDQSTSTLGWPLANGGKMKVTNLTVPPFEVVPIIIKKFCAKYFDDCIIFRGVPQALKFNIENTMACITSPVYFREISFS